VGNVEPLLPPLPPVVAHLERNVLGEVAEPKVAAPNGGTTSCVAENVEVEKELEIRSDTEKLLTQINKCG